MLINGFYTEEGGCKYKARGGKFGMDKIENILKYHGYSGIGVRLKVK
jgi:hypothetical protein